MLKIILFNSKSFLELEARTKIFHLFLRIERSNHISKNLNLIRLISFDFIKFAFLFRVLDI